MLAAGHLRQAETRKSNRVKEAEQGTTQTQKIHLSLSTVAGPQEAVPRRGRCRRRPRGRYCRRRRRRPGRRPPRTPPPTRAPPSAPPSPPPPLPPSPSDRSCPDQRRRLRKQFLQHEQQKDNHFYAEIPTKKYNQTNQKNQIAQHNLETPIKCHKFTSYCRGTAPFPAKAVREKIGGGRESVRDLAIAPKRYYYY